MLVMTSKTLTLHLSIGEPRMKAIPVRDRPFADLRQVFRQ